MSNINKKLHVYQDDNLLELTLKWYTPGAWFLLFFSMFWNGILIVVGSTMLMSGEGFAAVFLIFHLAAGLFLAYYTAALFFNKTYIDIAEEELSVHHKPLPWAGNNQRYDIKDVKQLYVKEHIKKGKNGTTKSYSLQGLLKDGRHKKLLKVDTLKSNEVKELERYVEEFLGIIDEEVHGEYASTYKSKNRNTKPRRAGSKFADSPFNPIYSATVGQEIIIKDKNYRIENIVQFDWDNKNSDRLFQLEGEEQKQVYLFIQQNKTQLNVFTEEEIPLAYSRSLRFNPGYPSREFRFDNVLYLLERKKSGNKFVTGNKQKNAVREWFYFSNHTKTYIRIVETDGMLRYSRGTKISPNEIDLTLNLNRPPAIEMKERRVNLDDRDFV